MRIGWKPRLQVRASVSRKITKGPRRSSGSAGRRVMSMAWLLRTTPATVVKPRPSAPISAVMRPFDRVKRLGPLSMAAGVPGRAEASEARRPFQRRAMARSANPARSTAAP